MFYTLASLAYIQMFSLMFAYANELMFILLFNASNELMFHSHLYLTIENATFVSPCVSLMSPQVTSSIYLPPISHGCNLVCYLSEPLSTPVRVLFLPHLTNSPCTLPGALYTCTLYISFTWIPILPLSMMSTMTTWTVEISWSLSMNFILTISGMNMTINS